MKLICCEGLIGAGKTDLCGKLATILNAKLMLEPVASNPYLDLYYKEPKVYALRLQFWLMSKRFQMHEQAIRHIWATGQSVVLDRSLYGDWVFAKKNYLDGNIDALGYADYCHHREVMDKYLMVPHAVIFLHARPEVCLERIKSRGRDCERSIPLEYLQGLHELHYELMKDMEKRGSKIYTVNWDSFGTVEKVSRMMGV